MPIKPRRIELLSPAKDLNCGIEAINHGAVPCISVRRSLGPVPLPEIRWRIFVLFVNMLIYIMPVSMWL